MGKIKIKKDDKVVIIAGEHKGAQGTVFKILRDQNKVLVEGVNSVSYTHLTLPTNREV